MIRAGGGESSAISEWEGVQAVPESVIEAIRQGLWDFEPEQRRAEDFRATSAMPGTQAKLEVLAARVRSGLPLWHPCDRQDCEELSGADDT